MAGREVFAVHILGRPGSEPLGRAEGWDLAYVPPAFGVAGGGPELAHWVRRAHAAGAVACAACAGVFTLAEAGLLDGREATTHWALAGEFAARFPRVRLDARRLLVDGGDCVCAGGVTAYFDLALLVIARYASAEAAAACARTLLLDPGRTSQTPYMSLLAGPPHGDAAIARAQRLLEDAVSPAPTLGELARAAQLGERTFQRRFRKATGRSPLEYLQALRVERAKRLLATSGQSVAEIADAVGYGDPASFFRLFRHMAGVTPGEYRQRFTCFAPVAEGGMTPPR